MDLSYNHIANLLRTHGQSETDSLKFMIKNYADTHGCSYVVCMLSDLRHMCLDQRVRYMHTTLEDVRLGWY